MTNNLITWVPTPKAVEQLGRSKSQLLRLIKSGHLVAGKHYVRGPFTNSPITWNVEEITIEFTRLARTPNPQTNFKNGI